jgi:acyl-CoA hydrolase
MTDGAQPQVCIDADAAAEAILRRVGKEIVLTLPLGLGKAIHIANALYARAERDPSISLAFITALTLARPQLKAGLERRFLDPIIARAFGDAPELAYVDPLRRGKLPANIKVHEFFLQAGAWLDAPLAQQSYISANYTHAIPLILKSGVNVIAQLVSKGTAYPLRYNLSCNTDVTLDLLAARRAGRIKFELAGQVNGELPYMTGEAEVAPDEFGVVLDGIDFTLPAPPRQPISDADHAMGLHIAALIPDGGTLQIGIGSLSHAIAQALILRHRKPRAFENLLQQLAPQTERVERHVGPFEKGLYASSEMFADALLDLYRTGVLKREVDGAVLDAAFFVGPRDFYRALRVMSGAERAKFRMRVVSFVNQAYGPDEADRRAARVGARFVNNAMMATLLGAVVSDGLEDGRVVSGVGGQFNFVEQAFALDGARAIVAVPATWVERGKASSNIRWNYGHATIPRHLRDIIVTEYGVADLRGKDDASVIAAMLAITDHRFQGGVLVQAQRAGKIPRHYRVRDSNNDPARLGAILAGARADGLLSDLPFGEDYTDVERRLMPALAMLKSAAHSPPALASLALKSIGARVPHAVAALERLGLSSPATALEHVEAMLVCGALKSRAARLACAHGQTGSSA